MKVRTTLLLEAVAFLLVPYLAAAFEQGALQRWK